MRIHIPEHRSPLGITTREDDVRARKLEGLKKEKNRKKAMSALVGEDHETANAPGDEMELVPSPLFSTMSGAHTRGKDQKAEFYYAKLWLGVCLGKSASLVF
jgi:hypothetical protein